MEQANFDQILERDILSLQKELDARMEPRETEKLPGREVLKESLQSLGGTQPASAAAQKTSTSDEDEKVLLPSYLRAAPKDIKLSVERLLELSIHKGVVPALKEAKKGDAYILDAFHDALVERLYPELQKRGLVK